MRNAHYHYGRFFEVIADNVAYLKTWYLREWRRSLSIPVQIALNAVENGLYYFKTSENDTSVQPVTKLSVVRSLPGQEKLVDVPKGASSSTDIPSGAT